MSKANEEVTSPPARTGYSRRDFIRAASIVGIGIPLVGLAACSSDSNSGDTTAVDTTPSTEPPVLVTLLRVGMNKPLQEVGPYTTADQGGLGILGNAGEYLCFSNNSFELEPRVAESWQASSDSTVWTFKIRQGITFHNGQTLDAEDVVQTFLKHLDETNKSQAAGALSGVLQASGIRKVDDYTVEFTLDAPTGGFPFIVSSDTYNLIILPRDWTSNWTSDFIGCGPWIMESYSVEEGVTFKRNPNYWDVTRQPVFETMQCTFFTSGASSVTQLLAGELDAVTFIDPTAATSLPTDQFTLQIANTITHLQVHMGCESGVFKDKRVRQAAALTLDRPAIIDGLLQGYGDLGNDSPMAPAYATTDQSVAQREKDIAQAKQLMADAGVADGFDVTLESFKRDDIDLLGQVIQSSFKEIGINVTLNITEGYGYYDQAWLNSELGITDYGHRGIPNVYLNRAYKSTGDWNAAHYKSATFDAAADKFMTSADFAVQQEASKEIQEILLDDTPIITPYFANTITPVSNKLTGFRTTGMGHFDAAGAIII